MGKPIQDQSTSQTGYSIVEVTTNPYLPRVLKENKALLIRDQDVSEGFPHYIATIKNKALLEHAPENARKTLLGEEFSYLNDGDIIRLSDNQSRIRVQKRVATVYSLQSSVITIV